jgi:hypothetical protein
MENQTFAVQVDALGFESGCARRGEIVTAEQLGVENVERLLLAAVIVPHFVESLEEPASAETAPVEPTLQERFAVGLTPAESDLTGPEVDWILDVQAGVTEIAFDDAALDSLTIAQMVERAEALGAEVVKKPSKKIDAVSMLKYAVDTYIRDWEVEIEEPVETESKTEEASDEGEG